MLKKFEQPKFVDDWEALAEEKLKSARVLLNVGQRVDAYVHAGIAIECALKARIMRREGLNRWPDREDRKDLYTHSLSKLLKASGLESRMLAEANAGTDIAVAWSVAKGWSVDARYARTVLLRDARDMVDAAAPEGKGLLKWIVGA